MVRDMVSCEAMIAATSPTTATKEILPIQSISE